MAIEPIVLTEFGETMTVAFPWPHTPDTLSDADVLNCSGNSYVGTHQADSGYVYCRPISDTHQVICCAVCGRITAPMLKEINTYAKLRQWCAEKQESRQLRQRTLEKLLPQFPALRAFKESQE